MHGFDELADGGIAPAKVGIDVAYQEHGNLALVERACRPFAGSRIKTVQLVVQCQRRQGAGKADIAPVSREGVAEMAARVEALRTDRNAALTRIQQVFEGTWRAPVFGTQPAARCEYGALQYGKVRQVKLGCLQFFQQSANCPGQGLRLFDYGFDVAAVAPAQGQQGTVDRLEPPGDPIPVAFRKGGLVEVPIKTYGQHVSRTTAKLVRFIDQEVDLIIRHEALQAHYGIEHIVVVADHHIRPDRGIQRQLKGADFVLTGYGSRPPRSRWLGVQGAPPRRHRACRNTLLRTGSALPNTACPPRCRPFPSP